MEEAIAELNKLIAEKEREYRTRLKRKKVAEHWMELRRVDVYDNGEIEIEIPDLNEYNLRLAIAGLFHRRDKNSVGMCWLRAHCARLGIPVGVVG